MLNQVLLIKKFLVISSLDLSFNKSIFLKNKKIKLNLNTFYFPFKSIYLTISRNLTTSLDIKLLPILNFKSYLFEYTFLFFIFLSSKFFKYKLYIKKNYILKTINYFLISISFYKKRLNLFFYSTFFTFLYSVLIFSKNILNNSKIISKPSSLTKFQTSKSMIYTLSFSFLPTKFYPIFFNFSETATLTFFININFSFITFFIFYLSYFKLI